MKGKRWRVGFFIVFLLLVATLVYQWMQPGAFEHENEQENEQEGFSAVVADLGEDDLRAYFPNWAGTTYRFNGEGMEYSSFSRKTSFARDGLLQIEDKSGTNLVQVVECTSDEIRVIWVEEEFYDDVSILNQLSRADRESGRETNLVILKAPLKEGASWTDERFQREIRSVDQTMDTPFGTIYDIVVVRSKSIGAEDFVQYEYYAKNIGLIKQETLQVLNGETYGTVSTLNDLIVR